ncbi:MAG: DinB family protein [Chloroflexota bacterium]
MSDRTQALAVEFDRATDRLVRTIREMSDGDWEKVTEAEGWSVAAVAHHVAFYMDIEAEFVHRLAQLKPTPALSPDAIDDLNARMASQHAGISKSDVLQLLTANRSIVRETLRAITDEQLEITYPGQSVSLRMPDDMTISIEKLIERLLIGHVKNHLSSIEKTIGA